MSEKPPHRQLFNCSVGPKDWVAAFKPAPLTGQSDCVGMEMYERSTGSEAAAVVLTRDQAWALGVYLVALSQATYDDVDFTVEVK